MLNMQINAIYKFFVKKKGKEKGKLMLGINTKLQSVAHAFPSI